MGLALLRDTRAARCMGACRAFLQPLTERTPFDQPIRETDAAVNAARACIQQLEHRITTLEDEDDVLLADIEARELALAAVRPTRGGTCSRAHSTRPHSAAATASNLALQH